MPKGIYYRSPNRLQELKKLILGRRRSPLSKEEKENLIALYPELRFNIENGRTLCIDCHRKTDTWGHKTSNLFKK